MPCKTCDVCIAKLSMSSHLCGDSCETRGRWRCPAARLCPRTCDETCERFPALAARPATTPATNAAIFPTNSCDETCESLATIFTLQLLRRNWRHLRRCRHHFCRNLCLFYSGRTCRLPSAPPSPLAAAVAAGRRPPPAASRPHLPPRLFPPLPCRNPPPAFPCCLADERRCVMVARDDMHAI